MDAADAVAADRALYDRLFRNFKCLGEAARQYGVSSAGGGYGHAAQQLARASGDVRERPCCWARCACRLATSKSKSLRSHQGNFSCV